ncbi:MAG: hypothetical protein J7604_22110 [Sporocytophaga sp.]|uniref:hypothetical protein n=1 Tax=Sporocytophaga sp. TaxID=2231183 RepID=UPI001B002623|nr:hypothetical protein [Sporocytophaga sp.]MBO9702925.1 hypothetical protein [Sporocytophaga sp.]
MPLAYQGSYSASKAGVRSLGEVINQELRLAGYKHIKVTTIEPWGADTPWWGHAANYSGGKPRMKAMDDPYLIVDVIIWSYFHPRKEIPVGPRRKLFIFPSFISPFYRKKFLLTMHTSIRYALHLLPRIPLELFILLCNQEEVSTMEWVNGLKKKRKKEKQKSDKL